MNKDCFLWLKCGTAVLLPLFSFIDYLLLELVRCIVRCLACYLCREVVDEGNRSLVFVDNVLNQVCVEEEEEYWRER
jgi:hypothetical protein